MGYQAISGARVRFGAAAALLVVLTLAASAQTAGAGVSAFFLITKTVIGTAPAGTTFTASVSCTASATPHPATVSFNASATPTSPNTVHPDKALTTCTVTETATGGANNVAYTCTSGPQSGATCPGANQVGVVAGAMSSGTINIVNTYLPPLTVSPSPATPGSVVTISGTLCTKAVFGGSASTGGPVSVTVGYASPVTAQTTAAGGSGSWSVQVTVPPGTPAGSYPVSAACSDPVAYPAATSAVVAGVTAAFTG